MFAQWHKRKPHMNVRCNQTSAGWKRKRKLYMYCCNVPHMGKYKRESTRTEEEKLDPTEQ
jgi:hypothetical protein